MDMNDANSKWLSRPAGPYIYLPEPWAGEVRGGNQKIWAVRMQREWVGKHYVPRVVGMVHRERGGV